MRREDWRRWRVPLGLAAFLVVAGAAVYGYSLSALHREERLVAEASQRLAELEAKPMPATLDAETLTVARAALPPSPELPQWIQSLRQSLERTGISWVTVGQGTGKDGAAPNGSRVGALTTKEKQDGEDAAALGVPFTVRVKGDYAKVFRLFQELGSWPRLVDASSWSLTMTPTETMAELSLVSYYFPDQADRPAGAVQTYQPAGKPDPTR